MVDAVPPPDRAVLSRIAGELDDLVDRLAAAADDPRVARADPAFRASAANLLQYLALRRVDVRELQAALAARGLSSLGRAEAHVLASVDAVRRAVVALAGLPAPGPVSTPVDVVGGDRLLRAHADALLGPSRSGRRTRVLATLGRDAARDPSVVHDLAVAGAEAVRIRCADDGPETWAAMIANVRLTEALLGRSIRVVMDLTGPRARTGPIVAGPRVRHLRPEVDELGRVTGAARVWLTGPAGPDEPGAARLTVDDRGWLERRRPLERVRLVDARGRKRRMTVTATRLDGVLCAVEAEAYVLPGTVLAAGDDEAAVGPLPAVERTLRLHVGDELRLVRDARPADPEAHPLAVGCVPADVLDHVRPGHRVLLDDGRVGAVVESVDADGARLWISDAEPAGSRLGAGARLNLPDSDLPPPALTADRIAHLPFVVDHADAVVLSSARRADDVAALHRRLELLGAPDLPVILKVESPAAFAELPDVLLAAMASPTVGVMIARGDLALEAGYVRLGEVQEEILWVCEAAHVPVVWATDVLDTLARTGRPSRAEITDAAASGRAEAVSISPGPHAVLAVSLLDDLLTRMAEHQDKKTALLRRLHAWDDGVAAPAGAVPAAAAPTAP